MLATRDNTRERQKAAADVVPTEEGGKWFTRPGLAAALRVSVRTVDRMLAAGEIKPVRLRGWSVRFDLAEVVECLRNGNRKFGRRAGLQTTDHQVEGEAA